MADTLKSGTKAWNQRQRVWRHNAFSGHARMMQMQLQAMANSDSTSWTVKNIARGMLKDVELLKKHLKTRIDP